MKIVVRGIPGPQGSKKAVGRDRRGRAILVESSKKVAPWREAVSYATIAARHGAPPIDEPVYATMVFTVVRPRGHYRTGKNAYLLRDSAPVRPGTTPDLSKLLRSTEDAITSGGGWRDDALVVEYLRLAKVYANEDEDALDSPGVVIEIWPMRDAPINPRRHVIADGSEPF